MEPDGAQRGRRSVPRLIFCRGDTMSRSKVGDGMKDYAYLRTGTYSNSDVKFITVLKLCPDGFLEESVDNIPKKSWRKMAELHGIDLWAAAKAYDEKRKSSYK